MMSPYAGRTERVAFALARLVTGLTFVYLIAPIIVLLPLSFTAGSILVYPLPGWSLRWYEEFLTSAMWTRSLANSCIVAVATTVLATVLGTLAALGLHLSKFRGRRLLTGLFVTPLVVPIVIIAVADFYFFAAFGLVGSYVGLILAHTVLAVPFVIVTVLATLQGLDLNLPRAGASLGARPHVVFRHITLPLILPGVISGALFAFITSFDEVVVALFLASPVTRTLPRQIFSGVTETITPTIAVAAVFVICIATGLMVGAEWLRRRAERLRGTTSGPV